MAHSTPQPPTTDSNLPYWLINIPADQRPTQCPGFLLNISDRNKQMISLPQSEYHILTWPEVQELIRTNRIDKFRRSPLSHRKYLSYMHDLKSNYGSVMDYVRDERLQWTDMEPKAEAFHDPDDVKILYNDWPYGIDKKKVHLCVWTKFPLENDPKTNDLTPEMRRQINAYVDKTFKSRVPAEKVIWFKNWNSLKSIRSIEHFHVMLQDPDSDSVREITNGDVAVSQRVGG